MAKPPIRPSADGNYEVELDPSVVGLLEHMCSELEALLAVQPGAAQQPMRGTTSGKRHAPLLD